MTGHYLDNAATTPVRAEAAQAAVKAMTEEWGNPSARHALGSRAAEQVKQWRGEVAAGLGCMPEEVVFTSCGTESDNWAIRAAAELGKRKGKHIITTAIEHEAVLKPLHYLEEQGFEVTYLPVDENGNISLDDFKAALRDDTILVTIMSGNNEVGSRMPIHEIGEILKDHEAWFHTDAVQTYGLLPIDVKRDHIDLLSTSAHKLNGPKMMGFLYRRDGINFPSYLKGGDQETKRRAGTENVPAVAAFAKAVTIDSPEEKQARRERFYHFKQKIVQGLTENGIDFAVNGEIKPGNLNQILSIWFKGISTYIMQTDLDLAGIAVSGGSACTAGSIEPSHVLTAMFGADSPRISESIRISFGALNTEEDVDKLIAAIVKIVNQLKQAKEAD